MALTGDNTRHRITASNQKMNPEFINTTERLEVFCARLRDAKWIAMDTEFLREKTYFAELCLIQIATHDVVACIDTLAIKDLSPLTALLYDPNCLKVLHAARQDLELFYDSSGSVPTPIFDTQVAATLAGLGEQIGYAALVEKLLGVQLAKTHTRTDWSRRPLSVEQLRYAADDVTYLVSAYEKLHAQLAGLGRLGWLTEDFATLTDPATYANPPATMWRRVKGAGKLKGVQLKVLQDLTAWREEQARQRNRPRRWILRDELLLDLARQRPADRAALSQVRGLEQGTIDRDGASLLTIIGQALNTPRESWPHLPRAKPLDEAQGAVVDSLMALLRLCAATAGVSAGSLASRNDLEELVRGSDEISLLHGWRAELAGRTLRDWLTGRSNLCVEAGRLVLTPRTD